MRKISLFILLLIVSAPLFSQDKAEDQVFSSLRWEVRQLSEMAAVDTVIPLTPLIVSEYGRAKAMYRRGVIEKDIGWGLFAAAPATLVIGWLVKPRDMYWQFKAVAGIFAASSCVLIPVGYVHRAKGQKKMNTIVEHYYAQMPQANQTTLRISPSLMPYDAPSGANGMALGMSLSVEF